MVYHSAQPRAAAARGDEVPAGGREAAHGLSHLHATSARGVGAMCVREGGRGGRAHQAHHTLPPLTLLAVIECFPAGPVSCSDNSCTRARATWSSALASSGHSTRAACTSSSGGTARMAPAAAAGWLSRQEGRGCAGLGGGATCLPACTRSQVQGSSTCPCRAPQRSLMQRMQHMRHHAGRDHASKALRLPVRARGEAVVAAAA